MDNCFVHLHLHTEYSVSDGVLRVDSLIEKAREGSMPAIAITELGNLFSLVKFYRAAIRAGIKPIMGAELRVSHEDTMKSGNLVVLCQNMSGYHNLTQLITKSYRMGQIQGIPYVKYDWLTGFTDGLIALSCAREGNIGKAILAGNIDSAKNNLADWMTLFPNRFYIELQKTSRQGEERYGNAAVDLAQEFKVPLVASNDVRFLEQEDFESHEARVCIQQGNVLNDPRRIKNYTDQQYLKTTDEMLELFSDVPASITNSMEIARRCNVEFNFGEYYLPDFPVPEGFNQSSLLKKESGSGLQQILQKLEKKSPLNDKDRTIYQQRLDRELNVINDMGFPGYFLIVADFIKWAKLNNIPVGPGRGSGAGSLVAYALGITELDPIEYDLLFERFLNPERVSLPDFDIDFCMDNRDRVIEYVAEKYGRDHVSQIITYGSMAAKAVVRDVGRVLGHPYGFVDQIAKLIPFDIGMTLEKAIAGEEELKRRYKDEEEVRFLIDLAMKLEGLTRNAGRHAGGLVIAPKPLTEYMPLYCEQGSDQITTQFDMGDVEFIGLVKFDFLGLRTLTIIDKAVRDANQELVTGQEKIDIRDIPLNDPDTYALIRRMETTAIFQLESDGIKKLIKRLKPDVFNDLIALVALFRPGPLQSGMVEDYIDRKHGRSRVEYPHPALEDILSPTNGVILYQEQVMQIAQVLASYSLGAADLLRRAMGKKKPEEMSKQREIFVEGALKNNVSENKATYIFDLMEKFAGYGFNKSHSAAYALLAYQTAWLKAHYPAAFMAAVFSSDMDNTDKIVILKDECIKMKLTLLPPSVNMSVYRFKVIDEKTILFGLGAIKGVGEAAIENLVQDRTENGDYPDLFDFCRRIDTRKINKRVLEALIRSGAADGLGPARSTMMSSLPRATQLAEQHQANTSAGQDDLFGLEAKVINGNGPSDSENSAFVESEEWDDMIRLVGEKETLGFYLRGHPISRYKEELNSIITVPLRQVRAGRVIVAGYIENLRTRTGARGRMAEVRIDDSTSRCHLTLYSETFEACRSRLIKDHLIIVNGEAVEDDYYESGYFIKVENIFDLNTLRNNCARLKLKLNNKMMSNGIISEIKTSLSKYRTRERPVVIEYDNGTACGEIDLSDEWRVEINDSIMSELTDIIGKENLSLNYFNVNDYVANN